MLDQIEFPKEKTSFRASDSSNAVLMLNDSSFEWIPKDSIDLVLTDPPFNIARDTNFHTYEKNTINSYRFDEDKGWDSYSPSEFKELLNNWSLEFERVLRKGGSFAVFCADEFLSDLISSLRFAGLNPRRTVTWRKPNAVPINRSHMMMSACEYIVVGVKGGNATFNVNLNKSKFSNLTNQEVFYIADKASTYLSNRLLKKLKNLPRPSSSRELTDLVTQEIIQSLPGLSERLVSGALDGDVVELSLPNLISMNSKTGKRLHTTEKPTEVLEYLISLFSRPGDIVLDPFSGSGSTGEAALNLNRDCILVEKDAEYFNRSKERLKSLIEARIQALPIRMP